ncbi:hypothetical protein Lal_00043600, partial [Lupinus albus]
HFRKRKNIALIEYSPATETTSNKLSPQSGIPISRPGQQSFLEYVQRWARLDAQVKPKLSDEESVSMFIDTLQTPFFDQMIGNVHSDFRQLIRIGERIENRFGSGKIKKSFANKIIQSDLASKDMEEETSFTEILS